MWILHLLLNKPTQSEECSFLTLCPAEFLLTFTRHSQKLPGISCNLSHFANSVYSCFNNYITFSLKSLGFCKVILFKEEQVWVYISEDFQMLLFISVQQTHFICLLNMFNFGSKKSLSDDYKGMKPYQSCWHRIKRQHLLGVMKISGSRCVKHLMWVLNLC